MPQQICSGFSLRPAQGRPVPPRSLFAAMQTVKDYPVVASFSRSGYKVKCAATVVGASAAAVPGASGSAGLPTEANNEVAVNSVGQPLAAVTNSTRPAVGTDEDEDMQILEVCQRLEDRLPAANAPGLAPSAQPAFQGSGGDQVQTLSDRTGTMRRRGARGGPQGEQPAALVAAPPEVTALAVGVVRGHCNALETALLHERDGLLQDAALALASSRTRVLSLRCEAEKRARAHGSELGAYPELAAPTTHEELRTRMPLPPPSSADIYFFCVRSCDFTHKKM